MIAELKEDLLRDEGLRLKPYRLPPFGMVAACSSVHPS